MYILSCLCLSFVAFSCFVGCYTRRYYDNLGQRLGLIVLGLGCVARVPAIWEAESVNNDWFLVHGGMALIAASTMWRYRRAESGWSSSVFNSQYEGQPSVYPKDAK